MRGGGGCRSRGRKARWRRVKGRRWMRVKGRSRIRVENGWAGDRVRVKGKG